MNYVRFRRRLIFPAAILLLLSALTFSGCSMWSRTMNLMVPSQNRPDRIHFQKQAVTAAEFDSLAVVLNARHGVTAPSVSVTKTIASFESKSPFDHIQRFREAGIRSYDGPATCEKCHEEVAFNDGHGGYKKESLRGNIQSTVHFRFNTKSGFSTWGFNGERVDDFPLGKIDRACGIPGSFTWTGWAALIKSKNGKTYSEGCGQCHIGGQYGPVTGTMMPGYKPIREEYDAIDCLICHAQEYDMNKKQVVQDDDGRMRWDQDRSMTALLSITRPTAESCLRCHQHNHGGDFFVENTVASSPGYDHPRLLHHGAKRGNPYKSGWDVHASAGMTCLDCHATEGHRIARGTKGTDLVGNDLPGVEVSCEKCHTATPHPSSMENGETLNTHGEKLACETCHIKQLLDDNIVLRDWAKPVYNEEEGLYTPTNVLVTGDPKQALTFRWFNGEGTFMAGALGDNPNGEKLFRSFATTPDATYASFDYAANYEKVFRPIAQEGKSRIYPFKRFNAQMFEDLNNQGPYGGMLLPFDYNVYYEQGDPKAAVLKAMEHPIMKKMYGTMFKVYLMNRFMDFMAVDGWNTNFSTDRIEPRWMRQDATLMINHGIQKEGRSCTECHTKSGGLLDFEALGYSKADAENLATLLEN